MAEAQHEEEVLGKAYDARLMRRLLGYLRPYRWQTVVALVSIALKALADITGPVLTMVAIDRYLAHVAPAAKANVTPAASPLALVRDWLDLYRVIYGWVSSHLNADPLTGIAQIAGVYVALLAL